VRVQTRVKIVILAQNYSTTLTNDTDVLRIAYCLRMHLDEYRWTSLLKEIVLLITVLVSILILALKKTFIVHSKRRRQGQPQQQTNDEEFEVALTQLDNVVSVLHDPPQQCMHGDLSDKHSCKFQNASA